MVGRFFHPVLISVWYDDSDSIVGSVHSEYDVFFWIEMCKYTFIFLLLFNRAESPDLSPESVRIKASKRRVVPQ
uniref:Ovule protein n=1 Tax=Heterorhabditis bacteriophora TaxID=37862 RepID=A0A1I7WHY7_HETBA